MLANGLKVAYSSSINEKLPCIPLSGKDSVSCSVTYKSLVLPFAMKIMTKPTKRDIKNIQERNVWVCSMYLQGCMF